MKKIAMLVAMLMIIPCAAFGMEMLDNNTMDSITGQSGVAIAMDDLQLFLSIDKMAYIDADGFNTYQNYGGSVSGQGAAFYIDNFQMDTININMIGAAGDGTASIGATHEDLNEDGGVNQTWNFGDGSLGLVSSQAGHINLMYDYGTAGQAGSVYLGTAGDSPEAMNMGLNNYVNTNHNDTAAGLSDAAATFNAKALTIDVTSELPLLTAGTQANFGATGTTSCVGGVLIGLPTMEIYINSMTMTPKLTSDVSTVDLGTFVCKNNNASYGTFLLEGITFTVLNGWMEIAPSTTDPSDPM